MFKYVIMGSRRSDPYCQHLQQLSFSDMHKGFPDFLRVLPVIDWSYQQIWTFLKDFRLPYCKMYDEGKLIVYSRIHILRQQNKYSEKSNFI